MTAERSRGHREEVAAIMVRRVCVILCVLLGLSAAFPLATGTAHGKQSRGPIAACDNPANQTWFQAGTTRVLLCPTTVTSGQLVRFTVHTRRSATVNLSIYYPDNSTSTANTSANGQGVAVIELPVQYNPINRYAQGQFTITTRRQGRTDQVTGTFTIAQAAPLGDVRVFARPRYLDRWCPTAAEACKVRNNATIIIRVEGATGAQVVVNLQYPDGQAVSCPSNDITGSAFADANGSYRCDLPVSFQARLIGSGVKLEITAQASAGGFTVNRSLTMYLVNH